MPKPQENFRKTQVFANSELEIVAEKRPKKEPGVLFLLAIPDYSSNPCSCFDKMFQCGYRETMEQSSVFLESSQLLWIVKS